MKLKYKKNKTLFTIRLNEPEYDMIKRLKEKHAINISGAFKNFLRELEERLDK